MMNKEKIGIKTLEKAIKYETIRACFPLATGYLESTD